MAIEIDLNAEWIQVTPAPDPTTGLVRGRDGRTWHLQPERVLAMIKATGRDVILDENHASELAAPAGGASPAMGWIGTGDWEVRDGALWARPRWTPGGQRMMADKAYRWVSPTLLTRPGSNGQPGTAVSIRSIALTNNPNLELAELNDAQPSSAFMEAARKRFKLPDTATEAEIIAAMNAAPTVPVPPPAVPPPVPVPAPAPAPAPAVAPGTFDMNALAAMINSSVTAAVSGLRAELGAGALKAEVCSVVDGAIAAGKIVPNQRDWYVEVTDTPERLTALRNQVSTMPVILQPRTGPQGQPPKPGAAPVLGGDEAKLTAMFNCKLEDLDTVDNDYGQGSGILSKTYNTAWSTNPAKE